jgi:hypothetical protein
LPNTLRTLVLVEASNTSFRLSTESSITYDVYTHSSANTDANAALWVQQDVGVVL